MILPKIDYHSHILPGIDDGAENAKKSILLIKKAKKYGIEEIYATPHCYLHKTSVDSFCFKRQQALKTIENIGVEIPIKLGAEILLVPGLHNLRKIDKLCMPDGNNILLELPLAESLITESYFVTAEQLKKRFGIVMAHPNRYSDFVVEQMLEIGAVLQINSDDVFIAKERKRIIKWRDMDCVYAIGSDVHQGKGSYRRFNKAYKYLLSK